MPFRDPKVYVTAEDLEAERRELRAYSERLKCRNPLKVLWWKVTGRYYLRQPVPDPPSSWESYP